MATTQELKRDGSRKVKEVCQEIMTREDEALAYRLQDEEFQSHYIRNREERGTARVDVKAAKNAYLEEVKQAGLLREFELQRLAEDDAWMASELQQRLDEEENLEVQQRTASEMQDEEYAQFLQEREKEKLKRERHRRLQLRMERERNELERIEREQSEEQVDIANRPQYGFRNSEPPKEIVSLEEEPNGRKVAMDGNNRTRNGSRSSEPGKESIAVDERARKQELEDEDFARRLQQQEDEKLRKLMEERDRKLALKMQRKETEEYRRERVERQSRKSQSSREHQTEINPSDGNKPSRSGSQKEERSSTQKCRNHKQCDPSLHYYEEPKVHGRVSSRPDDNNELARADEAVSETRPKANSITSRSRPDFPIYETLNPPSMREDGIVAKRRPADGVEREVERDQLQQCGGDVDRVRRVPSNDDSPEGARGHHFMNVAASLDPTFKGEFEERPSDEDKVWAIGDSGIKVSSASKPAPLIQNTKRKQSKGGKDKEKCKQQ